MNKYIQLFIFFFFLFVLINDVESQSSSSSSQSSSSTEPISYDGWNLIFQDEFEGSSLDLTIWNEISQSYDYNDELEDYTPDNIIVENGYLNIIAKQQEYQGHNYTSGKITTSGKFNTTFGRLEASIKLPYGQGYWPAFWLMPEDSLNLCWPTGGEIDIMENLGQDDTIYGTYHYSTQCNQNEENGGKTITESFSSDFNLYSVIWDPNQIIWMVNNIPYFNIVPTTELPLPTTNPFYIIFNVAVGGDWGGNPIGSTVFPQNMTVDYVRVYKRSQ
ncbi:hypothetical protein ACTFIU_006325 [Dictyostelium citrinum]